MELYEELNIDKNVSFNICDFSSYIHKISLEAHKKLRTLIANGEKNWVVMGHFCTL